MYSKKKLDRKAKVKVKTKAKEKEILDDDIPLNSYNYFTIINQCFKCTQLRKYILLIFFSKFWENFRFTCSCRKYSLPLFPPKAPFHKTVAQSHNQDTDIDATQGSYQSSILFVCLCVHLVLCHFVTCVGTRVCYHH